MYDIMLAYELIEEDELSEFRFHLCHYFDGGFDFNFPFRPLLEFVAECLRQRGVNAEVKLPDYLEFEDFIYGSITVCNGEVAIYFEHSLSYISFASNSQEDLNFLASASDGQRFQHEGYGLDNAKGDALPLRTNFFFLPLASLAAVISRWIAKWN